VERKNLFVDHVVESCGLDIGYDAKQFGHAPSLCNAPAWCMRRVTIKDLGNLTQARFVQMCLEILVRDTSAC
jgi:hypothetical protein